MLYKILTLVIIYTTSLSITSIYGSDGFKEALETGSTAAEFSGTDQNGALVELSELLAEGQSVVLIFYRGNWCGYCSKHLSELQDSLELIMERNASVVVVSPEKPEAVAEMATETGATFSIIHDADYSIMKAYQVDFVISEETVTKFRNAVIKRTAANNGNDDGVLPVPATYIINPEMQIAWSHFDPDYTKRSSVSDILQNLP